jgi:hypothetical protein
MERNPSQNNQRDKQLDRLAGQMRDTGVAPDRDLWPDIQAAIDQGDQAPVPRSSRRKKGSWLRFTAMAAALTLMLAAGWVGVRSIDSEVSLPNVVGETESPNSGLAVIDQALDDLVLALADDPENRNLSHLVLMIHKTRGNLLRRNSENLVRE